MIESSPIEDVRSRIDLVDVVAPHVQLQRAGRELRGRCPFHEEHTPSFYVNPDKQVWTCHGCHAGGDVFHFVELIDHVDFRAALEQLAARVGVALVSNPQAIEAERRRRREREVALTVLRVAADYYHHVLVLTPAGAPGRALLAERGVADTTRDEFHLGFAPADRRADNLLRYCASRGHDASQLSAAGLAQRSAGRTVDVFRRRLVIPIRDEHGAVVAFGGRALDGDPPKYLNSRNGPVFDKSRTLFGLDRAATAVRAGGTAVVVEGYFDVLAAHACGCPATVAACGTVFTPDHARLLRRFATTVTVCFDGDAAGQRAAAAAVPVVVAAGMEARLAVLPEGSDPDDCCRSDPAGFRARLESARPAFEVLVDRALGDAGPGTGPRTLAARRAALAVLASVPEASERDLYAQRVGQRLGVDPRHLVEDLGRPGWGGPARPPRSGSVSATRETQPESSGFDSDPAGHTTLGRTGHLLALLRQQPVLARRAHEFYGVQPEEFLDPDAQAVYRVLIAAASTLPEDADATGAGVSGRSDAGAAALAPTPSAAVLLGRLDREELPELEGPPGEGRAQRALEDGVRSLRLGALERRARRLQAQVAGLGHHRQGEVPRLVAELEAVQQQIKALRQGAPPTNPVPSGAGRAAIDSGTAGQLPARGLSGS